MAFDNVRRHIGAPAVGDVVSDDDPVSAGANPSGDGGHDRLGALLQVLTDIGRGSSYGSHQGCHAQLRQGRLKSAVHQPENEQTLIGKLGHIFRRGERISV